MEITRKSSHGFTLLEILVTIGIVGAVGVMIAQVFVSTTRSNAKTEAIRDIKQNGDFALATMVRMVNNAQRLYCDSLGTPMQSVSMQNFDGNTVTLGCLYNDSVTRIASTSSLGTTNYLTSNGLTIGGTSCLNSTLKFTCVEIAGVPSTVKIEFYMATRGTATDFANRAYEVFQANASLRNY